GVGMRDQDDRARAVLLCLFDNMSDMVVEAHCGDVRIRFTGFETLERDRFRVDAPVAQPVSGRLPGPTSHPGSRDEDGLHCRRGHGTFLTDRVSRAVSL